MRTTTRTRRSRSTKRTTTTTTTTDGPAAKPKPKTPTPKKVGDQSLNGSTRHNTWTRDKMPGQGSSAGANRPGEIPLLMPANVNRNKVFFELEGTGEAVDLEGDVGVVGRLLSNTSEKHGSGLQMDMKGVIYDARILPTPASVVILAVNATEAKVESITHDFVQLRRTRLRTADPAPRWTDTSALTATTRLVRTGPRRGTRRRRRCERWTT